MSAGRLTYCTNVHPGESAPSLLHALGTYVAEVKRKVSPAEPFGVGLRVSAEAARDLRDPDALAALHETLATHEMYVFTLNGFPYGGFHGRRVKEQVYRPDWRTREREAYSRDLAHLLTELLPDEPGLYGSISTVPLGFRQSLETSEAMADCAHRLLAHTAELVRLERATGRELVLALEPEPECALERIDDVLAFFTRHLLSREALIELARATGLANGEAERALRRHLGVCLDACHAAVIFESPVEAVERAERAGVRIAKLQISAGLDVSLGRGCAELEALARFADDVYLHQVFETRADGTARYLDLPDALAAARRTPDLERTWRIHFHVPVFVEKLGPFRSTQAWLAPLLERQRTRQFTDHLEVETYTWDVLPPEHRALDVTEAIARELLWARERLRP